MVPPPSVAPGWSQPPVPTRARPGTSASPSTPPPPSRTRPGSSGAACRSPDEARRRRRRPSYSPADARGPSQTHVGNPLARPHRFGNAATISPATPLPSQQFWCPGWELNPHAPVGAGGFKTLKYTDVLYRIVPGKCRLIRPFAGSACQLVSARPDRISIVRPRLVSRNSVPPLHLAGRREGHDVLPRSASSAAQASVRVGVPAAVCQDCRAGGDI